MYYSQTKYEIFVMNFLENEYIVGKYRIDLSFLICKLYGK